MKLEGTQIELIHKYINPLLNIAHVIESKTKNKKYIQHTKNQKETHVTVRVNISHTHTHKHNNTIRGSEW